MGERIGGVDVVDGTEVKWGLLASIMLGSPVLAYFYGVINVIQTIGGGVQSGLAGVESFLVSLAIGPFDALSSSIGRAWLSFSADAQFAGVFTFTVAVAGTGLTLVIIFKGVEVARG